MPRGGSTVDKSKSWNTGILDTSEDEAPRPDSSGRENDPCQQLLFEDGNSATDNYKGGTAFTSRKGASVKSRFVGKTHCSPARIGCAAYGCQKGRGNVRDSGARSDSQHGIH